MSAGRTLASGWWAAAVRRSRGCPLLCRVRAAATFSVATFLARDCISAKVAPIRLPPSLPLVDPGPVIGVDEAGRGSWAGPVVAAAVAVGPITGDLAEGVVDSKRLQPRQREQVYETLISSPHVRWSVGIVSEERIAEVNILQATHEAMAEAVDKLKRTGDCSGRVLVDGPTLPKQLRKMREVEVEAVIKGDSKHFAIAAASVVAKVTRDRVMAELHEKYPQYGFDAHKGYGTKRHQEALEKHGPSPIHRRTYKPIAKLLGSS